MDEHVGKYKSGGGMVDQWECICGWESEPYFDGVEYAEREFKKHVKDKEAHKLLKQTLGVK